MSQGSPRNKHQVLAIAHVYSKHIVHRTIIKLSRKSDCCTLLYWNLQSIKEPYIWQHSTGTVRTYYSCVLDHGNNINRNVYSQHVRYKARHK